MTLPLWFYDLAIYSAQFAILILAGGLMVWATGLRPPRARLAFWQAVLVVGLLLPGVQPWRPTPAAASESGQPFEVAAAPDNVPAETVSAPAGRTPLPISPYKLIALALAAGFVFRLLWLAAGMIRLRRSRRAACPLGRHAAAEELKSALEVSPAVLISDRLRSPVTFGWRAPLVILPAPFARMDAARQRAILCHEFLHVRRRDWRWHVGEEFLRAVFWFHLAVTWLIAQIRLSREQLVDQEVVALTGSRRDYLDALFEAAAATARPDRSPAPLFLRERHLKRRVALILKEVAMSRKRLIFALSASFGTLALAGALAATLLPLRTSAAPASAEATVKPPVTAVHTHFYGNPNAGLTVVEYGDFECSFCGKVEAAAQEARERLGNQMRFAYRQFPLTQIHPHAEKAAEASECAAQQGRFWQAVNYFYAHQPDLSVPSLEKYAGHLGLDQQQFNQCLSSGEMAEQVQGDIRDGRAAGVTSVPTFFIGNTKVVGVLSYDRLHSLIEQQHAGDPDNAAPDPLPQAKPAAQKSSNPASERVRIDQAELKRQVEDAVKRAQAARLAASKIDQEKIREQVEQAMMQARIAQETAAKLSSAEVQQALAQAKRAQQEAAKINWTEVHRQMAQAKQALDQAKIAEESAAKINQTELRQQLEQAKRALNQAKIAQQAAERINWTEVHRAMEQAKAAMKQAEQARRKAEEQLKESTPLPPAAPPPPAAPSPAPQAAPASPLAPPSAAGIGAAPARTPPPGPAPPSAPRQARVIGGVPGGEVTGVPGGVASGIVGGKVSGVPGGITGAVVGGVPAAPSQP